MDYSYILQAFVVGAKSLFHWQMMLMMLLGVIYGLVFGIVPGIGGSLALILILPFIPKLGDPLIVLPFMIAIHSVGGTGGGIAAILLNIPGSGPSAATLFDGFPMTQKGEAGRALGASRMADLMGDVVSVIMAILIIPVVLKLVFAINTGDMVFIILVGLAFVGIMGAGSSFGKGIVSGLLGLLISLIGYQSGTGADRFTFGTTYLYDGIPMVPLGLGLFGFPTILKLLRERGTLAPTGTNVEWSQVWQGCMDCFRHFGLIIRTAFIGFVIGLIPALGGEAAAFICYGQAKMWSKHPEEFGKGAVEGVIAPQCAENAKEAGALITTMALGIPGSTAMAIMLMGYLMLGLTPGPQMMKEHLDVGFSMILMIIVSGATASLITILLAKQMARIALVPARFLVPSILSVVFIGAYSGRSSFLDILLTIACGVLGICMAKFGYSRPAMALGFVLGFLFEKSLYIAYGFHGWWFFNSPISYVMILIIIYIVAQKPLERLFRKLLGLNPA